MVCLGIEPGAARMVGADETTAKSGLFLFIFVLSTWTKQYKFDYKW